MKKISFLFTRLAAVIIMLAPDAVQSGSMTDVRLMNSSSIFKSCGYTNGVFEASIPNETKSELNFNDENDISLIEGNSSIDTAEEFITAVYYSPIKLSASAKKSILAELPEGKTGALRVAAMWFFKIAESPENREKYMNAVNLVLKMSNEKHGVSVTVSEARKFYEEAIREKIYSTPLGKPLTVEEQKKVKELLLAYMLEPGERTQSDFTDFKDTLNARNVSKGTALITFVKKISGRVNIQLA